MGLLGDVFGLFAGNGDEDRAKAYLDAVNAQAGTSAFAGIEADPALRAQQLSTMRALQSIGQQGGMRVQDRVAQQQATDAANRNEQGNRAAIFQNMAQRGMGGSAFELSQQLANQQGQAQRAAMVGQQAASDASQRALRAIASAGEQAGQVRGQDFGEAAGRAQALDSMARFNAGQRLQKAGMQSGVYADAAEGSRRRWTKTGDDAGSLIGGIVGGLF